MSENAEQITIIIDGKECKTKEGEFILNVARANDIFVPAICYLTRCSPTLACRLCLVEADGKQVYSCNAKSKDGMVVKTTTDNIEKERTEIMKVYNVNHPLQCGVCDQSGECELQNYTLYQKLDKQSYAVKDVNRQTVNWGVMNYDPGLCIVCEKCVSVCKDMIGSNALSTVKRGADPLDSDFKANMPKDAYAMWNKLNKNLIGFEEDKCVDCGECISVCPVGALVSSDFQYKSNAWELVKIPASNPFSSDCALMYYEVKHESIGKNKVQKIYRVTNDSHFTSLSGAARFAFDYYNTVKSKDEKEFTKAIKFLKNADTIKFNSYITNEEAFILQKIKDKLGIRLVNNDALKYQNFLKYYSSTSGHSLYNGTLEDIHNSNFVISVGSYLKSDAPNVRYAFNNAISMNKAAGLYFHPMYDLTVEKFGKVGKTIEVIQNKVGSEEAILYFILDQFGNNLPKEIIDYLNTFKENKTKIVTTTIQEQVVEKVIDKETNEEKEVKKMISKKVDTQVEYEYTKLLDLIGSDEKLFETIISMRDNKDKFSLIIGEDLISHKQSKNLAKLCGLIEKYTEFKIIIIPTQTNTLGVSLICTLDDEVGSSIFGYNQKSDFEISALLDDNLDMPTLNQQEGTFTNIDKKIVPTNAAVPYYGYELNDIANEILEKKVENTIDYTKELFKKIIFDDLDNYFSNDFKEHRGYCIDISTTTSSDDVAQISKIDKLNDMVIYKANPINQFNEFTALAKQFKNDKVALYVSPAHMESLECKEGDLVNISANGNSILCTIFY
ncbi:NADH-ubiquinone oxidoreductase chain G [hydrothermal vent metagenome]|uniref:NADH-ubiquinone oxidoreductase chain G n=1 Tax=hydrothermal vent metagenome TaxID=652676 RepID=A0A3B1DUC6_9ZZZZ